MRTLSVFLAILFALTSCDSGNSPGDKLLDAAAKGNLASVKTLVDQGVDINYQNSGFLSTEETPCMKAAKNGHLEVLQYLVAKGADFHKATSGGENPLTIAAEHNHANIVTFLLDKGEDINYKESNYGKSALHHAAEHNNVGLIKKLLKRKADISLRDKKNNTPFTSAVFYNKTDAIEFLLKKGADANEKGQYGQPAIVLAVQSAESMQYDISEKNKKTVDILLQNGANINAQDSDGNTCLIHAAQDGNYAMVQYLLKKGANPGIQNNNGYTYQYFMNEANQN